MGKIHKLSPQLADMIAAGEVVERPASVIKELVENAIDAGAKKITVEIKNGGITFMRVADDGCGMSQEDATTAFLRHATSKIACAEDLGGIVTMGFRGEALAAISSVSKIDLLTRGEETEFGTAIRVEAGNVVDVQEAGCPQGTTMIVRDLFYNTPARMKFLKRDSVEGSYIAGAVQRQALGHPEIAFRFIRDGKPELNTPGDGRLISAIYAAMGRTSAQEMVAVETTSGGITLKGYVGKPTASRGSRGYQHFFVNGRYVKSRMLSSALEEAYKNQIMTGRFPICVLHVELPATAVDVNVHPAKTEVKFLREGDVFDAIHYGVLGALSRCTDKPEMKLAEARPQPRQDFFKSVSAQEYRNMTELLEKSTAVVPQKEIARQLAAIQSRVDAQGASQPVVRDGTRLTPQVGGTEEIPQTPPKPDYSGVIIHKAKMADIPVSTERELPPEPTVSVEPDSLPEQMDLALPEIEAPKMPEPPREEIIEKQDGIPYRIIGQALDTYIIVEQGDGLLLFDKHAAHERILFEKLKAQKHDIMSQMLLSPLHLTLSREEMATLLEHSTTMEALGFSLEDFGGDTLVVRAIPGDIDEKEAEACLSQLAQNLMEGKKLSPDTVFDEMLHTVACKAAIKGGRRTDPQEIAALVAELMAREDIKYCPHGRPVCITLSRNTLERQFKRQV